MSFSKTLESIPEVMNPLTVWEEESDPEPLSEADRAWEVERLIWKEIYERVRTGLEALIQTHLDETLAVALTEEQLEQYRETMGTEGLEDMIEQFMADDEAGIVQVAMFVARQSGQEIDVDEKVLGLYKQFAYEFVEKLSLGYA